ncbi:hypothetical protein BRC60_03275 [Halobacteriales archaeon QH_1_68_42]|nr:MAG: hypothetical protein BRC60_03275 [Halobacteriales archaeon QH_1_68_42]
MTLRSWGYATVDFLIAAVGLFVVVFPALSVVVALATGDPLGAGSAGFVVATGGNYPFVAGDWPYGRLERFVAALLVTTATASLLGLAALSRLDVALPSPVVARAAVLAVAYPVATVVASTGGQGECSGARSSVDWRNQEY